MTTNRETWLNKAAELMRPRFEELGFPIPKFRVATGFTSGGQRSNAAAECWNNHCSDDQSFEIFIAPDQVDEDLVLCHLAHELTHAAVGFDQGHKGNFAKVCKALGLAGKMTATIPGPAFVEYVRPFREQLGPIPHARLKYDRSPSAPRIREYRPDEPGSELPDGPVREEPRIGGRPSTAKPKQGTRLKKAECSQCGYTVRVTQRWLEVGPPHCPQHGAMDVDIDIPEDDQEGEA